MTNAARAKLIADKISTAEGRQELCVGMFFPLEQPAFGETFKRPHDDAVDVDINVSPGCHPGRKQAQFSPPPGHDER